MLGSSTVLVTTGGPLRMSLTRTSRTRASRRERAMCATRREVGMRGNLHRLYRQAMSRWGVASVGCNAGVKELAPERYW